MKNTANLGLSLLMILAVAIPSLAQTQADADNAYRTLYAEMDPAKKAALCEEYIAKFKDGGPGATGAQTNYLPGVYRLAINQYIQTQNWPKVLEKAERLNQVIPSADNSLKMTVYTVGMAVANQTNNPAKTIEFGEKVLGVDGNNLDALVTVSYTMVTALPQDAAAKDAALNKAMDYAKKAAGMPKPANVADAQWQPTQVQIHTTIGFVHQNKQQYPEAASEFEQ